MGALEFLERDRDHRIPSGLRQHGPQLQKIEVKEKIPRAYVRKNGKIQAILLGQSEFDFSLFQRDILSQSGLLCIATGCISIAGDRFKSGIQYGVQYPQESQFP